MLSRRSINGAKRRRHWSLILSFLYSPHKFFSLKFPFVPFQKLFWRKLKMRPLCFPLFYGGLHEKIDQFCPFVSQFRTFNYNQKNKNKIFKFLIFFNLHFVLALFLECWGCWLRPQVWDLFWCFFLKDLFLVLDRHHLYSNPFFFSRGRAVLFLFDSIACLLHSLVAWLFDWRKNC